MYRYQITVATPDGETFDGKPKYRFLFRTDWMETGQALDAVKQLREAMPGNNVQVLRRNMIMDEVWQDTHATQ